jgi:hypothetical protein
MLPWLMPASKTQEDELKRLTFWIVESVAKKLKRNAKERRVSFPVYLCNLVQDGLATEELRRKIDCFTRRG